MKRIFLLLIMSICLAGSQAVFTFPVPATQAPVRQTPTIVSTKIQNRTLTINHRVDLDWATLAMQMSPMVRAVRPQGSRFLFLEGERGLIDRLETLISQMDVAPKTIDYSIAVVEVSRQGIEQLGVNWQGFFDHWKSTRERGLVQVIDQLSALVNKGEAKLMASPMVSTVEGIEAHIRIGDRVPYTVPIESANKTGWQLQYLDAGIDIKLKGVVLENNVIRTQIQAVISNIKQWKATPAGDYPILGSREVVIDGEVKSGETLVLGGLSHHQERNNSQNLPFLADIPGISSVFDQSTKEQESSEVLFLLTPTVKQPQDR